MAAESTAMGVVQVDREASVLERGTAGAPQLVMNYIRDGIREGRLLPGDRVIEREIARELALGGGPVREGIQLLMQQGFLVRPRQRSPRVKLLSREEVFDFLEVWEAVGPLLFR